MHIEIVTTPNDALKESGFGTLNACNNVLDAIQKMGFNVRLNVCTTINCLDQIIKRKPKLVILAVKYIPIENENDIWLSDYFARHRINFSGSSREVLAFDSNKVLAKTHLTNKGIKTANYFIAVPGQYKNKDELPIRFPLFLKPLDAANGNGIDDSSFAKNFTDYEKKIASLYDTFKQPILIEEYLDGREFTVAVIKTLNQQLLISAVEIIPPESTNGLRILGAHVKKNNSEKLVTIANSAIKNKVTKLAIAAFNALNVRDFGRIDIKTNKNGECFFMEANLVPGLTQGSSYFPLACHIDHEFAYDKVIALLLSGGLARAALTVPPRTHPDSNDKSFIAI